VLGAQSIFFISQSAQNLLKRYYSSSTSLPSPFLTMTTQKTQVSTSVLAHVFCILIYPSSMSHGHRGHGQAHWCSPMSYISHTVSLFLSLQHYAGTQDTIEHTGACSCPICPYYCPLDPVGTPRTWVSTLVLVHVLIYLSLTLGRCTRHEWAHQCSPVSLFLSSALCGCPWHKWAPACSLVLWALLLLSFQHGMDAQDMSEHTGAHSCHGCPYLHSFDTFLSLRAW